MHFITSKYAPYKGAFRAHPDGRQWLNPETGTTEFYDYAEAYQAVRQHLLTACDWAPTPEEWGGLGGLMPEGQDRSWFNFGDAYVNADGEEITISES